MISNSRIIARARPASRISESFLSRLAAAALCLFALLAGSFAALPSASAREWPKPQGHLSDFAEVVDAASRDSIEALGRELKEKTGAELAVVTLADLGGDEIEPVAVDLFHSWGIGQKGRDDGVLILQSSKERRVRIEVGYGVEGILPDGLCGSIIRRVMAPELMAGRIGTGLLRGARAVAAVIARDRGVVLTGAWEAPAPEEGSGRMSPLLLLIAVLCVTFVWTLGTRLAWARGSIYGGGDWMGRRNGPRNFGDWFGGFGGFGGGQGGGGFGGFGGGGGGGGGASGGY